MPLLAYPFVSYVLSRPQVRCRWCSLLDGIDRHRGQWGNGTAIHAVA
jgi:hypothetical protein